MVNGEIKKMKKRNILVKLLFGFLAFLLGLAMTVIMVADIIDNKLKEWWDILGEDPYDHEY
jgi:hypothetical protein